MAAMFDRELFDEARREFLSHLLYAKGHSKTTCYVYNSDLGIWGNWLVEAGKDWQAARYPDVEQFAAWLMRERGAKAHIVNRRLSALSTFYKWLMRSGVVEHDPVALADKPKRPLRIPVWLEKEEQARFEATLKDRRNIPINIFGDNKAKMTETRRRYEMLFGLLLNSGLRISEALALKATDVRILDGLAKSVRVNRQGRQRTPCTASCELWRGVWVLAEGPCPGRVRLRPRAGPKAGVRAGGAGLPAGDAPEGRHRQEDFPT
jgi:integrase/recombinase XerD